MANKKPKKIKVELIPREDDKGEVRQCYAIMDRLIGQYHPHLASAEIALAWQIGNKPNPDGILRLGQCRKASDLDRELHEYDFVILLNHEAWNAAEWTVQQMEALLDHELCHAQVAKDPETGEDKEDSRGRPVWRIRKHDVEEFTEIVQRHGLWVSHLETFAREAMARVKEGELFKHPAASVAETLVDDLASGKRKMPMPGGGITAVVISTEIDGKKKSVTLTKRGAKAS